MEDCSGLLALAQQLNIQVVGVAFHVGSGATNPQAFADAIAAARLVCLSGYQLVPCQEVAPCTRAYMSSHSMYLYTPLYMQQLPVTHADSCV